MQVFVQLNRIWTMFIVIFVGYAEIVFTDDESKPHQKQYTCCARHEKIINVGHDIFGEVIDFDVGHCRKLCPKNVFYDPGDRSKPAVQKCTQNRRCRPRASKIERISTVEGIKELENIEICECSAPSYCKRKKYNHLVYTGTPYQTNVDIGVCTGYCDQNLGCKPVKNRTASIRGPNGSELYHIIEKCSCTNNCYRIDHVETILDYRRVLIRDGSNSSEIRAFVKQVDVGKCVGNCEESQAETCLFRDNKSPAKCFAGYISQGNCTPVKFQVQEYRNRRGVSREIIQITECACV